MYYAFEHIISQISSGFACRARRRCSRGQARLRKIVEFQKKLCKKVHSYVASNRKKNGTKLYERNMWNENTGESVKHGTYKL